MQIRGVRVGGGRSNVSRRRETRRLPINRAVIEGTTRVVDHALSGDDHEADNR